MDKNEIRNNVLCSENLGIKMIPTKKIIELINIKKSLESVTCE